MIACTRGSGATLHTVLPPAAVSAVSVPREWPKTPACAASTRFRSHPGSAFSTYESVPDAVGDAVRHVGLRAVAGTERRPRRQAVVAVDQPRPGLLVDVVDPHVVAGVVGVIRRGHDEPAGGDQLERVRVVDRVVLVAGREHDHGERLALLRDRRLARDLGVELQDSGFQPAGMRVSPYSAER